MKRVEYAPTAETQLYMPIERYIRAFTQRSTSEDPAENAHYRVLALEMIVARLCEVIVDRSLINEEDLKYLIGKEHHTIRFFDPEAPQDAEPVRPE